MNSSLTKKPAASGDVTEQTAVVSASVSGRTVSSALALLNALRDATNNQNVEAQVLVVLLSVASREGGHPMNILEVARVAGVAEASASRIIATLGRGLRDKPGCGLVETHEDPSNYSRKLIRLTPKGTRLVERLHEIVTTGR